MPWNRRLLPPLFILILGTLSLAGQATAKPLQSHFTKFSRSLPNGFPSYLFPSCKDAPYRAACETVLLSLKTNKNASPKQLFDSTLQFSLHQAEMARAHVYSLGLSYQEVQLKNNLVAGAMKDCMELLDDTIELLSNVINSSNTNPSHSFDDIQTWLSAAVTNQETCMESLQNHELMIYSENSILGSLAENLFPYISNSLALYVSSIKPKKANINPRGSPRRSLLSDNNFPTWFSMSERKLLEASVEEIMGGLKNNDNIKLAVVAKDGSGTHKTIGEAVYGLVLMEGKGRTVIHVKAGIYHENLKFSTKQKNVMLIGDGKGKTIIVGDRNSEEGWSTFQSATVAAMGDGFIARDMTFVNNAGPAKHQAVALRVGADKSVIFRCSVVGYQDTLYTLSKRQFYRESDIYGTIDFIFGNSAVVLQNCNIFVRKSSSFQDNFITAQGRSSQYQNTGISIHNCKIGAASDLVPYKSKVKTFLGRPWKPFSRTVIMQSFLDDSIHPSGWSPWSGSQALKTLYYGEYMNSGPGASTSGRVGWPGYHASLTTLEAQTFTVAGFISGNQWLPSTGVSFDSGLIG